VGVVTYCMMMGLADLIKGGQGCRFVRWVGLQMV